MTADDWLGPAGDIAGAVDVLGSWTDAAEAGGGAEPADGDGALRDASPRAWRARLDAAAVLLSHALRLPARLPAWVQWVSASRHPAH
jgi:hypothetical protein